jgi:hypothetical protein
MLKNRLGPLCAWGHCQRAPSALYPNGVLLYLHHHIISISGHQNYAQMRNKLNRSSSPEIWERLSDEQYHMFPFQRIIRLDGASIKPVN